MNDTQPVRILGLHGVRYQVTDVARAAAFYTDHLGFRLEHQRLPAFASWERVESDRFERARNLFFQYRDKDLSFTDCTSFATMRELRLTTVLTTDGHFRQVGFEVLPATRPRRTRKLRRA
jgi:predicted nucleic acid-binding protein